MERSVSHDSAAIGLNVLCNKVALRKMIKMQLTHIYSSGGDGRQAGRQVGRRSCVTVRIWAPFIYRSPVTHLQQRVLCYAMMMRFIC